jgi:mono/diheme cytochrome c family protein
MAWARVMLVGIAFVVATAVVARAADAPAVYDQKCKSCHSIGGVGGPMAKIGGPLDGVGSKRDEAWLKAYIADPKSKMADAKMPKLNLSAAELDAVTAYMLSLK